MTELTPDEEPFEFPGSFTLKAMGANQDDFPELVYRLIQEHVPELNAADVSTRSSREGKYLSVSVTFIAQNREQLDKIYQSLHDEPRVLYVL